MTRLSTGIDVLDQMLLGGIPAGTVVALVGAPASQSELFLYELAARRPSVYLTTERSATAVRDLVTGRGDGPHVNVFETDLDDPLSSLDTYLKTFPRETTLVVDPVDALERRDHESYAAALRQVKSRMVETDGIAVLHCLDGATPPAERDTTLYHADVVFALTTRVLDDEVVNRLAIPKFRGYRALNDTIKLDLGERVVVDTSRNIS